MTMSWFLYLPCLLRLHCSRDRGNKGWHVVGMAWLADWAIRTIAQGRGRGGLYKGHLL